MGLILKLNEFFVEGHEQDKSHVLLHVIQPSTPEEEKTKGYFFAISEINNGDKEDVLNLQRIIDEIENEYYESKDLAEKNTLETVLEKINQENGFIFSEKASLNFLVGVIVGNELIFSYHGRPETLFFYKNKNKEYNKINLIELEYEENTNKIFQQVVQGKINAGDFFFVATKRVMEYFSEDRVQKIVTSRNTEQSSAHLEKVLTGIRNGMSFGGIIIHMDQNNETTTPTIHKPLPVIAKSNEYSLSDTERKTANTLAPTLTTEFNNRLGRMMNNKKNEGMENIPNQTTTQISSIHLREHRSPTTPPDPVNFITILKNITIFMAVAGKKIGQLFLILTKALIRLFKNFILLFIALFNIGQRRKEIIENWKSAINNRKNNFKNLPLLTKILGGISIIAIIIFISSVFYLQYNKKKATENKQYIEQLTLIKNKADSAESSLIYNNNAEALKTAEEAEKILTGFSCREDDKENCDGITDQLKNIGAKARKMLFTEPQILVDWGELGFTNINKIFKINNLIVGYSNSESTLRLYNTMTKENKDITPEQNKLIGYEFSAVPKENDYALLVDNTNQIAVKLNPQTNNLENSEISYPNENSSISSIKGAIIYSQKLYTLDIMNNMVYKHQNTKTGFGPGNNWRVDDSENLRDAVDITIDGSIYILKSNGEIYKFTKGAKESFNITGLDPVLTNGNRIYTYNEWQNIYILDTAEKRIVTVDKEGKLIRQYKIENMSPSADMIVEEENGYIYLLDNNQLSQIEI